MDTKVGIFPRKKKGEKEVFYKIKNKLKRNAIATKRLTPTKRNNVPTKTKVSREHEVYSYSLEVGVGHEEDKSKRTFKELDYDAAFAFNRLDATGTTFKWTIGDNNLSGIFEFAQLLGSKDTHIFGIRLDCLIEIGNGRGRYAHMNVVDEIAVLVGICFAFAGAIVDKEKLIRAIVHELLHDVCLSMYKDDIGEKITLTEHTQRDLIAIARGVCSHVFSIGFVQLFSHLFIESFDDLLGIGNGTRPTALLGTHDIPYTIFNGVVYKFSVGINMWFHLYQSVMADSRARRIMVVKEF